MEFYTSLKEELTRMAPTKTCCVKAELSALIKVDGIISISKSNISLHITHNNASSARKLLGMLRKTDDIKTEIIMNRRSTLNKGKIYTIKLTGDADVKAILKKLGILEDEMTFVNDVPTMFLNSKCCRRSYLRGLFIGCGYFGKPEHGYHMEFCVSGEEYAKSIIKLLGTFGVEARILNRRDKYIVYVKSSDNIVEVLNIMGATNSSLEFENMRIVRGIRNNVNRLVNADQANIAKSGEASMRQIEDIQIILKNVSLSNLPESLVCIMDARLENPDASLTELGEMVTPNITKSGVNHRMRRIAAMAKKYREETIK